MSEYVRAVCPKCEAAVKVEADSLGEWVTCPKCDKDFVAKQPRAAAKPLAKPVSRRDEHEEDEERPRRKSRREEEDDEDARPRKKGRDGRSGKGPSGDFAFNDDSGDRDEEDDEDDRPRRRGPRPGMCPGCGSRKSSKVTYTWWGGLIGPAVFGLVKCGKCRKQYMGGSGKPLGALQIIVYSLVVGAIGIGVVVLVTAAAR